jgi:hypothetical protein
MMQQKFFSTPFALTGDQVTVPDADPGDGSMSFTMGWTPQYSLELADPASRKLDRDSTNYLFYVVTGAIRALQMVGIPEWITTTDNDGVAFPYAKGAHVRYSATPLTGPWVEYVSTEDANTDVPGATTAWQPALLYAATGADVIAGTDNTLVVTPLSLINSVVGVGNAQTISGVKTFSARPIVGTATPGTGGTGAASMGYVDAEIAALPPNLISRTIYTAINQAVSAGNPFVTPNANGQAATVGTTNVTVSTAPMLGSPFQFIDSTGSSTLPSPLAFNTTYYQGVVTSNTMVIPTLTPGGANMTWSGTGTGSIFIKSPAYTPSSAAVKMIRVILQSGGGAGYASTTTTSGGGGGGGMYLEQYMPVTALTGFTPIPLIVGSGGAGGGTGLNNNGLGSQFGVNGSGPFLLAWAGASPIVGQSTVGSSGGGGPGSGGGPLGASNISGPQGKANVKTIYGANGGYALTSAPISFGGAGGSSPSGPGAGAVASLTTGAAVLGVSALPYSGAGGSGASAGSSPGAGGSGGSGYIIIEEYSSAF